MSDDLSIKKILVPIDGSDSSMKAASDAIKLASMAKAEIICIHAVGNPPYVDYKNMVVLMPIYIVEAERHAKMWFETIRKLAEKENVKMTTEIILDVKSIADVIVNYAKEKNVDLIVIGTKGRTGVKKFLLGSVASGVVSHAGCLVLVVR